MRLVSAVVGLLAFAAVVLAGSAPVSAEPPLPVYDGLLSFPTIKGSADPEEYSWRVELGDGQTLKAVDDQHAEVTFEDGHLAWVIKAESAHDARGKAVPTSISISEGDVITLTVHHRAGNVAADGVPFTYPITLGPGFEVGYSTVIVTGPKDEQELREERERIAREAAAVGVEEVRVCVVPALKGQSLKVDRRRLREAGCRLGDVRGIRSKTAKVIKQFPAPGTTRAASAEVAVKLAG